MKNESPTLTLVKTICRALDAKKAEALRVSDVRAHSSITDYIIVATGTADTHLRALRVELEKVLDAAGARILGMDGQRESGWLVVDAFDVMIHLFLGETRQHYRLEQLWQDAPQLDLGELLAEPKPSRPSLSPRSARAKKGATAASSAAPKKTAVKKTVKKAAPAVGKTAAEKAVTETARVAAKKGGPQKAATKKTAAKTAAAAAPEKGTSSAAKKSNAVKKAAAPVKKSATAARKVAARKTPTAKKTVAVKKTAKK